MAGTSASLSERPRPQESRTPVLVQDASPRPADPGACALRQLHREAREMRAAWVLLLLAALTTSGFAQAPDDNLINARPANREVDAGHER
jgi:hypothetical protein